MERDPQTTGKGMWVLLFAVAILTLPQLAESPATGLDPSWRIGLHLAREHGLTVGEDVFFTYGPWGFLTVPLTLSRPLWLESVVFRLTAHIALFVFLGLWAGARLDGRRAVWAVLPLLLLIPQIEYRLLLAILLALAWAPFAGRFSVALAGLAAAAGAATAMIKFSMGLAALLMVAGAALAAIRIGRRSLALALAGGFAIGGVLAGLSALGSIDALVEFLSVSWEISRGYAEAQVRGGPLWQPLLAMAGLACLALGLARSGAAALKPHLALLLPAAGLAALVFKHAFIRQETHVPIAFSVGSLLALWIVLETAGDGGRPAQTMRLCGVLALVVGALVLDGPVRSGQLPLQFARNAVDAVQAFVRTGEPGHREELRATLRRELPIDRRMLERLEGHTVDVMTVETSMVEAWDLDWSPRRVLQSYAVGTARLDAMDAERLTSDAAPTRLLVDLQGLDTRHPFMDSPRTWRAIFRHYRPLDRNRRWLLLGRRSVPREVAETEIESVRLPLNEALAVPRTDSGHVEMRVHLEPSLLGRLAGLAWKRPEVRLLVTAEQPQSPRRVVPSTANESFPLLYPWVDTPAGLRRVFDEPSLEAPFGVSFFTGGSWAWKPVELEFVRVRFSDDDGA